MFTYFETERVMIWYTSDQITQGIVMIEIHYRESQNNISVETIAVFKVFFVFEKCGDDP
jgi:predicted proteasome-type protease